MLGFGKKKDFGLANAQSGSNDLDFDIPDFDAPPPKDDRAPVTKIVTGVAKGAVEAINPATLNKVARKALPDGYGHVADFADEVSDNAKQLYDTASKTIKPSIRDMSKAVNKLLPASAARTKEALNKIENWAKGDVPSSGPSVDQQRESAISLQMADVFKEQAKQNVRDNAVKEAKDSIKESIDIKRHQDIFGVMNSVNLNTTRLAQYQDNITIAYQKKSLELQYRHYYLGVDALTEAKRANAILSEKLDNIVKNTGLPDIIKSNRHEVSKSIRRNKFHEAVNQGLFGKRDEMVKTFFTNLTGKVQDKLSNIASAFGQGASGADQFGDMTNSPGGMGGEDGATTAGRMIGNAGMEALMHKGGKHLRNYLDKNHPGLIDKTRMGTRYTKNAGAYMKQFKNSDKGQMSEDGPLGFLGKLWNMGLGTVKDSIDEGNPDKKVKSDTIDTLQDQHVFTKQTNKSINEIIPGYLARILREATWSRTGTAPDLEVYDFKRNTFTSKKGLIRSIKKDLFHDTNRLVNTSSDDVISKMDTKKVLSEKNVKIIKKYLADLTARGQTLDLNDPFESFKVKTKIAALGGTEEDYQNILDALEATEKSFGTNGERIEAKTAMLDSHNNMRTAYEGISSKIGDYADAGQLNQLKAIGAVDRHTDNISIKGINKNLNFEGKGLPTLAELDVLINKQIERINSIDTLDADNKKELISKFQKDTNNIKNDKKFKNNLVGKREQLNKVIEDFIKETTGLSDINVKEDIKEPKTKSFLDSIKNIKIFDWKYKKNKTPKDVPVGSIVTGPMSQQVNKELGNEAAPGGTKLDLLNMNGANMKAIQELDKKVDGKLNGAKTSAETTGKTTQLKELQKVNANLIDIKGILNSATLIGMNQLSEMSQFLKSKYNFVSDKITNFDPSDMKATLNNVKDTVKDKAKKLGEDIKNSDIFKKAQETKEEITGSKEYKDGKTKFDSMTEKLRKVVNEELIKAQAASTGENAKLSDHLKVLGLTAGQLSIELGGATAGVGNSLYNASKQGFNSIKTKVTEGKDYIKNKIENARNIYIGDSTTPRLLGIEVKNGKYFLKRTMTPITGSNDIVDEICTADGEIVISKEEVPLVTTRLRRIGGVIKHGLFTIEAKTLSLYNAGMDKIKQIPNALTSVANKVKTADIAVFNLLDMPTDIYVKGKPDNPVMLALIMRAGGYVSAKTGKIITRPSMIDGAVRMLSEDKSKDGLTVLTDEDIQTGIVDKDGKPIRGPVEKIASKLNEKVNGIIKFGKDLHGSLWDAAKGLYEGGAAFLKKLWNGVDIGFGISSKKTIDILTKIHEVLDSRLPASRRKRKGGVEDQEAKEARLEKEKADEEKSEVSEAKSKADGENAEEKAKHKNIFDVAFDGAKAAATGIKDAVVGAGGAAMDAYTLYKMGKGPKVPPPVIHPPGHPLHIPTPPPVGKWGKIANWGSKAVNAGLAVGGTALGAMGVYEATKGASASQAPGPLASTTSTATHAIPKATNAEKVMNVVDTGSTVATGGGMLAGGYKWIKNKLTGGSATVPEVPVTAEPEMVMHENGKVYPKDETFIKKNGKVGLRNKLPEAHPESTKNFLANKATSEIATAEEAATVAKPGLLSKVGTKVSNTSRGVWDALKNKVVGNKIPAPEIPVSEVPKVPVTAEAEMVLHKNGKMYPKDATFTKANGEVGLRSKLPATHPESTKNFLANKAAAAEEAASATKPGLLSKVGDKGKGIWDALKNKVKGPAIPELVGPPKPSMAAAEKAGFQLGKTVNTYGKGLNKLGTGAAKVATGAGDMIANAGKALIGTEGNAGLISKGLTGSKNFLMGTGGEAGALAKTATGTGKVLAGTGKAMAGGVKLGGKAVELGLKGAKFGMKALGPLGFALGAKSAYDNFNEGNYGMAALDAGLAALGAATLLTPVGLAVGLATVGYLGYKFVTRDKANKLEMLRYIQYGFSKDKTDYVHCIFNLEGMVKEHLVYDNKTGVARFEAKEFDLEKAANLFSVSKKDEDAFTRFTYWLGKRFKPIYLTHATAIHQIDPKSDLDDADKLKGEVRDKFIKTVAFPDGPYGITDSPTPDYDSLPSGAVEVSEYVADLQDGNRKDDLKKGGSPLKDAIDKKASDKKSRDEALKKSIEPTVWGSLKDTWKEITKDGIISGLGNSLLNQASMAGSAITQVWKDVGRVTGFGITKALDAARFRTYGLTEIESAKVRALIYLEDTCYKAVTFKSDGSASFNSTAEALMSECGGFFGITAQSANAGSWLKWFTKRFLPVYLCYVGQVKANGNIQDLSTVTDTLKGNIQLDIANKIITQNVWSLTDSPWSDYTLNTDPNTTADNIQFLKDKATKDKAAEEKAKVTASRTAELKGEMSGKPVTPKTNAATDVKKAIDSKSTSPKEFKFTDSSKTSDNDASPDSGATGDSAQGKPGGPEAQALNDAVVSDAGRYTNVGYQMGGKNPDDGVVDCSGWVSRINKDGLNAVAALVPGFNADAVKKAIFNGNNAAGIIKALEDNGGKVTTKDQLSLDKLTEGMIIGEANGEGGNKPRGVDHIVQVIRDTKTNKLMISESRGDKGVITTSPEEYLLRKNRSKKNIGLFAIDAVPVYKKISQAGKADTKAPAQAASSSYAGSMDTVSNNKAPAPVQAAPDSKTKLASNASANTQKVDNFKQAVPGGAAVADGIDGTDTSQGGILKVIDTAAKATGADPKMMKVMAAVESSLDPNAKASGGSASGLYQFTNATWNDMMNKNASKYSLSNVSVFDPKANALMGGEYLVENTNALKSVKPDVNEADVYLAHLLGPTGAKKLLSADPNTPADSILSKAAAANPAIFYDNGKARTVSQVYEFIKKKLTTVAANYNLTTNLGSAKLQTNNVGLKPGSSGEGLKPNAPPVPVTQKAQVTPASTKQAPVSDPNSTKPILSGFNSFGINNTPPDAPQNPRADMDKVVGGIDGTLKQSLTVQTKILDLLTVMANKAGTDSKVDAKDSLNNKESIIDTGKDNKPAQSYSPRVVPSERKIPPVSMRRIQV